MVGEAMKVGMATMMGMEWTFSETSSSSLTESLFLHFVVFLPSPYPLSTSCPPFPTNSPQTLSSSPLKPYTFYYSPFANYSVQCFVLSRLILLLAFPRCYIMFFFSFFSSTNSTFHHFYYPQSLLHFLFLPPLFPFQLFHHH